MINEVTSEGNRLPLCLSDIDGFENVIARMPTPDECRDKGLAADGPVLIMRRRGGKEQIYAAGMVELTIDTSPEPAPSATREAALFVVGQILEDLDNVRAKVAALCHAAESPSREIVRLADEYRQRAEEVN